MNPETLIATCNLAGVFLRMDGDRLKAYGQESAIARLLPTLKAHREELKAILSEEEREFYEERAAIAEFDGGLSRTDAERQAMQEVRARRNKRMLH